MVVYLWCCIVITSSHCEGAGGGMLSYGVLPMVLHIGVNPSSHCRCVGGGSF